MKARQMLERSLEYCIVALRILDPGRLGASATLDSRIRRSGRVWDWMRALIVPPAHGYDIATAVPLTLERWLLHTPNHIGCRPLAGPDGRIQI